MIAFFIPCLIFGTVFRYDNTVGRKYRIKNLIKQDVFVNGVINRSVESMDKAMLEVIKLSNDYALYQGKYDYYEKNINLNESYKLENEYGSSFYQDELGKMIVSSDVLMPVLRSVPTFPTNDLKPGDSWKADGEEIHEGILTRNNIMKADFPVYYIYLGDELIENKMYSKFSIDYHIMHYPKNDPNIFSFTGYSHSIYYWDISNSCPAFYNEDYAFLYTLHTGETVYYTGQSEGKGELVSDIGGDQKKEIITEMSNKISKNSGISIRDVADGIILSLGNILFDFNKYSLKSEFEKKLESVADVLRKYPQIDIAVSGYTDNVGSENYNLLLSENRAKTVADFLIKKGISPTRLSYIGLGSKNALAPNTTDEGRSLNRRVEIKLITKE